MHRFMHTAHQIIDMPQSDRCLRAVTPFALRQRVIRWIKIIIEMDCIHVVIFHDLFHAVADILLDFLLCRIVIHRAIIRKNPVRMFPRHIVSGKLRQIRP